VLALIDQGWVSASTFGTTALIARTAGLEDLGTFTVVWTVVLLVNAAQGALVIAPMASLLPSDPKDTPQYYEYYVRVEMRFLAGLLAGSVLMVGVAAALMPMSTLLVASALSAILAYQLYDFVRRFAHVTSRHLGAAVLSGSVAVGQLGVLSALAFTGHLAVSTAFTAIAVSMGAISLVASAVFVPRWSFKGHDAGLAEQRWRSARWLLGSAVMQWTSGHLFVMLAPLYVGLWGAGALRAAQSIVGVVNVWHQGLENVIPIHAGKLWRGASPRHAVRYVGRVSLIWTLITGVFVTTIALYADPLLRAVYGEQVAEHRWVLQWYAVVQFLIFLGLPLRSLLRAAEQTRGIFLGFAAATVFSVATVLPLLGHWGLTGALIGLTAAQVVFQVVLALHMWWHFQDVHEGRSMTLTTTHP
jgi:O-antigen/teichoic acid export membrane protein